MRHCGGRLVTDEDDHRLLCDLAGHVARDAEPSLLDKLLSNMTPEHEQNIGPRVTPDLEALIAKALAIPGRHPLMVSEDDDE